MVWVPMMPSGKLRSKLRIMRAGALAETPCKSDGDFFAKAAYLLACEYRLQGGLYTHACAFGDLAFAIELHLEQQGVIVAPAQEGGANV